MPTSSHMHPTALLRLVADHIRRWPEDYSFVRVTVPSKGPYCKGCIIGLANMYAGHTAGSTIDVSVFGIEKGKDVLLYDALATAKEDRYLYITEAPDAMEACLLLAAKLEDIPHERCGAAIRQLAAAAKESVNASW